MPRICFFKHPVDHDPYEVRFKKEGWDAHSVPVLAFNYVNKNGLERALTEAHAFSGLICTSSRAVEAFGHHNVLDETLLNPWQEKPIYVVGPATQLALESIGLRSVGEVSGNAEALAHFITQHHSRKQGPLLFICGHRRRDELPAILKDEGIGFEECVVYETHPRRDMNLASIQAPDLAVFFSPSGVQAVHNAWPKHWNKIGCVAIGARTAAALMEIGKEVLATSSEPTPEGLLEAIKRVPSLH